METRLKRKLSAVIEVSSQEEDKPETNKRIAANPATLFHVASSSSASSSSSTSCKTATFAAVKEAYFDALENFYHTKEITAYKKKQRWAGWFCFTIGILYLRDYENASELNDIALQHAFDDTKKSDMFKIMENFIRKNIFDLHVAAYGLGYDGPNNIFQYLKANLIAYLLLSEDLNLPSEVKTKLSGMREFLGAKPKVQFSELAPQSVANISQINEALKLAFKNLVNEEITRQNNNIFQTLKILLDKHFNYIEISLGTDAVKFMLSVLHKTGDIISENLLYKNNNELGAIFIRKAAAFNYSKSKDWLKNPPKNGDISDTTFSYRQR
jgi:hypothetical protein